MLNRARAEAKQTAFTVASSLIPQASSCDGSVTCVEKVGCKLKPFQQI